MKSNHKSEISWADGFIELPVKNETDLAIDIGISIAEARIVAGLTQLQLAKRMETLQPSIARIESGASLPSFKFLLRIAKALRTHLVAPTFESIKRDPRLSFIGHSTLCYKTPYPVQGQKNNIFSNITTLNNSVTHKKSAYA